MSIIRRVFKKSGGPRLSTNKRSIGNPNAPFFYEGFKRAAQKLGYTFEENLKKRTDLILVFGEARSTLERIKARQKEGAKVVQRVDGIWGYKEGEFLSPERNRYILDVFNIADAVIYQSEFNRRIFEYVFPPARPECRPFIIYNGADTTIFKPDGPKGDRFGYDHVLVTSATWNIKKPWKGLDAVYDVFKALGRDDCLLQVVGQAPDKIDHPQVRYLGQLKHNQMAEVFRAADVFIFFPWFDICPNNVVEAICCGLPVVTSNQGGQTELIGKNGILVQARPERDMANFYKPAGVDIAQAVAAINTILENPAAYKSPRPDLTIENCVQNYIQAFRETLGWWEK